MRVGIIGGGASGLYSAYLLNKQGVQCVILEKNGRLGGNIFPININNQWVDLGFQVFNKSFYPKVSAFFDELRIPVKKTNMSFGFDVCTNGNRFVWGSTYADFFKAISINGVKPTFHFYSNLILWIIKAKIFSKMPAPTKPVFDYFLNPLTKTLWSLKDSGLSKESTDFVYSFLKNHKMLNLIEGSEWLTIDGSSKVYLDRLISKLSLTETVLNFEVQNIKVSERKIEVYSNQGSYVFDAIIFSLDADTLYDILSRSGLFGSLPEKPGYSNTRIVVHSSRKYLPAISGAWNMVIQEDDCFITYDLFKLQGVHLYATLNCDSQIDGAFADVCLRHPIIDRKLFNWVDFLRAHQGQNKMFYAGAYFGNCFHEDAFKSAQDAAQSLLCLI